MVRRSRFLFDDERRPPRPAARHWLDEFDGLLADAVRDGRGRRRPPRAKKKPRPADRRHLADADWMSPRIDEERTGRSGAENKQER